MQLSPIESDIILRNALEADVKFFFEGFPVSLLVEKAEGRIITGQIDFHHNGCDFCFSAKLALKDGILLAQKISLVEKKEKSVENPILILYFGEKRLFCYRNENQSGDEAAVLRKLDDKSIILEANLPPAEAKVGDEINLELVRKPLPVHFSGTVANLDGNTIKVEFSHIHAEVARQLREVHLLKSSLSGGIIS